MDKINYGKMVETALRTVVRSSLQQVSEHGLPGDHHFYITFQTGFRGVIIPDYLHAKFPDEMTIVIQHQFYGLDVFESYFSITLTFSGIQERLTIPFNAVVGFVDPSTNFGLKFQPSEDVLAFVPDPEEKSETNETTEKPEVPDNVISFADFRKKVS